MTYILFRSLLLSILHLENLKHIFGFTTSSIFSAYFSQVDDVDTGKPESPTVFISALSSPYKKFSWT